MNLVKVLRLRERNVSIDGRLSTVASQNGQYKGSISDVRLEIYFENVQQPQLVPPPGEQIIASPTFWDEFELKFIEIAKPTISGQAPEPDTVQRYKNIDNQYGNTTQEAQDYVVNNFIQKNAIRKLMQSGTSLASADLMSKDFYTVVQDPWKDEPPLVRYYGEDPYFLNNGVELRLRWYVGTQSVKYNSSEYVAGLTGGPGYSNEDGSETYNRYTLSPGTTPSNPFIQTTQDIDFSKSEKAKISKSLIAIDKTGGVKFYTISSNMIVISGTGSYDQNVVPDNFPGNIVDIDIINKFIDLWKTKVPNYDLKLCQPSYYPSKVELEFKSPLSTSSAGDPPKDNQSPQNNTPEEAKFKLSIVYDSNAIIKADSDIPDINIYVGDPPKEGEFLFDEDEFDDLALLDEEYKEDDFKGEEELAYALNNTGMEGADGELSINEKKESALRTEELNFEGLNELRPLPKKGVGKTETERANNLYAEPYGLTVKTVEQAKSASYKKLLEKTNFGTEMYFSGSIMGNKQKLINSSSGSLESVFMSELKYNGKLTWKNDAGTVFKTGKGATFKSAWSKLDLLVHKAARAGLESAYAQIQKEYGLDKMWDLGLNTSSGTYYPRAKRNGTNPSIHSWGVAIDICAGSNGLDTKCPSALFCKQEYKRFIDIMEAYGWYSLGRSWGQDYMHFQAV